MSEQNNNELKFECAARVDQVSKRDGTLAPFDASKIYNAILKAGATTGELNEKSAHVLTEKVLLEIAQAHAGEVLSIEDIQDLVKKVLIKEKEIKFYE